MSAPCASSAQSIEEACQWLGQQDPSMPLLIIASNEGAGLELLRRMALRLGFLMGWKCQTPLELATAIVLSQGHRPTGARRPSECYAAAIRALPNSGAKKAFFGPCLLWHLAGATNDEQAFIEAFLHQCSPVMMLRQEVHSLDLGASVSVTELPRTLLRYASRGIAFDRMAVTLHQNSMMAAQVRSALARAEIPVHVLPGTPLPSLEGKAILALLRFKHERFAHEPLRDYLALTSQMDAPAFDRLLVEKGVPRDLQAWHQLDDETLALVLVPLLTVLGRLKDGLLWREWLEALEHVANAALTAPRPLVRRLRALRPLEDDVPVSLGDVLYRLSSEIATDIVPTSQPRYGSVCLGDPASLSGYHFDVILSCAAAETPQDGNAHNAQMEATHGTEYALAFLREISHDPKDDTNQGRARFLLAEYPHVARALRNRALRWRKGPWSSADGFASPSPPAKQILQAHRPEHRAYSPTALQQLAACPYRFFLQAIVGLKPPTKPRRILFLDALERGSLVHEVLFEFLTACSRDGLLPLASDRLREPKRVLKNIHDAVSFRYARALSPLSLSIWEEELSEIHADLEAWLEHSAKEEMWQPWLFELSFGLPGRGIQDPQSVKQPISLDAGLKIRGAIDLVERHVSGSIRATDFKTGRARHKNGLVTHGGEVLQPVIYALALEKLFEDHRILGGRLYYCTSPADFAETWVPLTEEARNSVVLLARALDEGLSGGIFVADPLSGRCRFCDYQTICGPDEEVRARTRRSSKNLPALSQLRKAL
ncbi:MAG: PD-(D/E)XK nuclease family protein [Myxococcales bacterium]|nr:PD-(D/E)XK nuclease family protein [Myxococcales bacterium]MCB9708903.1 PD-(D/E)XK nuclease family protein [Myxococcales bacterium]